MLLSVLRLIPGKAWLAVGAVLFVSAVYLKGEINGAARVELRVEREVAAERARQWAAGEAALEAERAQTTAREAELAAQDAKLTRLQEVLAARPPEQSCKPSAEDAERLNDIS